MNPGIRTVTLGLELDPRALEPDLGRARRFFARLERELDDRQLAVRSRRLTCQPLAQVFGRMPEPEAAAGFARAVETGLGEGIWFCLPGPFYRTPQDGEQAQGDSQVVARVIRDTRHVFMNALVGSTRGMHRQGIRLAAETMTALGELDAAHQANFRFAAMANVGPNTPFFPASYHEGPPGFSIALELAEPVNRCFAVPAPVDVKLERLGRLLQETAAPVVAAAEAVAAAEDLEFKGIDFSLAPYPGQDSSAVRAVERLNDTAIGTFDFLFSLYAVNNVLKAGSGDCPQVGYNGTMFSVMEDSHLARSTAAGACELKDLLLYSTLCGCGLDMVPLALDTPTSQLASLIQAMASQAGKWNKPLLARLLPSAVDEAGLTRYRHDFIVNTRPLSLKAEQFAQGADRDSFFTPFSLPPGAPAQQPSRTPGPAPACALAL